MIRTLAFALLQATFLVGSAHAQEQIIEISPELVEDFDFITDGHIGKVEFIQLLEELAPPTCNVLHLWQSKSTFQSALQELSCLCTEFGGADNENCCNGSSQPVFAVQGQYDDAYDHVVCEHIEQLIRVECFDEAAEEEPARPSSAVSKPPSSLRSFTSTFPTKTTTTTTTTTSPVNETSTISSTDVTSAMLVVALILALCVILLLRILSFSIDTEAAQRRHQRLLRLEKHTFEASMEITSTTPYVQIV